MSGMSKMERDAIAEAQARFLANGGQITRCPQHAESTGKMRFNYARKAHREREEMEKADEMERTREQWNREMGFRDEARKDARGYEGEV
jgi:hypothetical protein